MNNVLFKRKTTLIVWRQQNKGKDLFEEILNEPNIILHVDFVFFKKCGGKRKKPKNEGGTLWRHLKNLRKKVSLSRKQLLEAFEKIYIFLKGIWLKSHSAEIPKKRSFRPIKRFLQTENFKKMHGVPFDDIRKFSKKVAECRKKPKGGTLWSHLLYFWKHKNIMV